MTAIVCVHGIAQQVKGEAELLSSWVPALRSGVRLAEQGPGKVNVTVGD